MKIKPLQDKVLIEPIEEDKKTQSGIILNSINHEKPEIGIVVAFGKGNIVDDEEIKIDLKENDKVLFNKYAGTEITLEGKEYIILKYCDILAIIE